MLTLLIIAFLYHLISGKDTTYLLEKIKVLNLERKVWYIILKIKNKALTFVRLLFRAVLRVLQVFISKDTSWFDKILLVGGLAYIIVKHDLLPFRNVGFVGALDELGVLLLMLLIIYKDITPDINLKVHGMMQRLFGYRKHSCVSCN